eukprot:TRINITY_DN1449_c0_g1_i4.p1 TRINITY_DN1449_c0_g1~~TRINITY_DN1449_c0_g1_i4.p1  ORF type:complete len:449 (-),score=120.71 TRINITY_DN1449_c0_g1_i4:1370-2716(-)
MGKNKGKKWAEKRAMNKKTKPDELYVLQKFIAENFLFDLYYYAQFMGEYFKTKEEFIQFRQILNKKLPIVFRVNPTVPHYEKFLEKVAGQSFLDRFAKEIKEKQELEEKKGEGDGKKEVIDLESIICKEISWFPLVYQLNMDRQQLKRSNVMESLHKHLQKATDSGMISRQELVSMIPPLLLDLKGDDIVLDMCAAPGSKTSQMLEFMYNDHLKTNPNSVWKGAVIANEIDYTRAYMLTHQVQRMNSSAMVIVNHAAQFFPALYLNTVEEAKALGKYDSRFYFDKILADVPCSGDGAIRKLPQVWQRWSARDAMGLHRLQVQIVMRGLQMLKEGGTLLYSTCSLSPLEDEAVITQLFRNSIPGSIELIDIHEIMKSRQKGDQGLIARRGLLNWTVMEENKSVKEYYKEKQEWEADFTQIENYFKIFKDKTVPRDPKSLIRGIFVRKFR